MSTTQPLDTAAIEARLAAANTPWGALIGSKKVKWLPLGTPWDKPYNTKPEARAAMWEAMAQMTGSVTFQIKEVKG